MPDFLNLHRVHIEQDQSFLDDEDIPPVFSWRSAGVAVAMLMGIILTITLFGVMQP